MSDPPPIFLCQVCDQTPERGHAPDCPGSLSAPTDPTTNEARAAAYIHALANVTMVLDAAGVQAYYRPEQRVALLVDQRDELRKALSRLVGASEQDELDAMEAVIRMSPAPAEDRAAIIDAIHALKVRA